MLDAWSASPARFREDANAEEALAVGGYAGRVLVELASNAVDAASEQGVSARIRLRRLDDELRIANTGAPLTADGVAALSSLRASAKRDTVGSVGHFGVGFTAVLSCSAAPRVISSSGGVRFDPAATAAAIATLHAPALNREVVLRGGAVPALRLPWPTEPGEPPPPDGYTTEVRLPLLPAAAADLDRLLNDPAVAEDLLWALPDLTEIDLPGRVVQRTVDDVGRTVLTTTSLTTTSLTTTSLTTTSQDGAHRTVYRTADRAGATPTELLADRPVEERGRTTWRVTWALPELPDTDSDAFAPVTDRPAAAGRTVGAPTPTDEPLTVPARLIGTFPVDDTRRRLAQGPLCDYLLERAADTYLDLVAAFDAQERWKLFPVGGFPAGPVDGVLREAIRRRLEVIPLLTTAVGDAVSATQACVLPGVNGHGARLFGQAVPGLLPPQPAAALEVLRPLGVSVLTWSEASSAMAAIDRDPHFWWQVYDAVATAERPPGADDLADLPVPLSGGRRVLGARGCLLPAAAPPDGASPDGARPNAVGRATASSTGVGPDVARRAGEVVPGLRIIDPGAAHPYLERLGARPADADAILADPALAASLDRMRADLDDFDPDPDDVRNLAAVVLDLIALGGRASRFGETDDAQLGAVPGGSGALPAELVLTTDDGQPWPASELLLPNAPLASVLSPDADRPTVGREWLERYASDVLVAAGVREGFAVVGIDDPADPSPDPDLPDFDRWLDQADAASTTGPMTALADLDLVDADRWPEALRMIAADRAARECVLQGPGSYTGWWLSRFARINGEPPGHWRLTDARDLDGLYDPLPVDLDPRLAHAIGVRSDLAGTAAADPEGLLDRLADPDRTVPAARVAAVTEAVVAALAGMDEPVLPQGVRTLSGAVVDADDALVLDLPWFAQVLPPNRLVPGGADPAEVGRVLDLVLASALVDARCQAAPADSREDTGERLRRAAEAVALDLRAADIVAVQRLSVMVDGATTRVRWWGEGDRLLTDGSADGAGRAAAWAADRWADRYLAVAAAADDGVALAEDAVRSPRPGQISSSSAI